MMFDPLLCNIAGLSAVLLGLVTYLRYRQAWLHRILALGLLALALEQFFQAASLQAVDGTQAILWQRLRLSATVLIPGIWLFFAGILGGSWFQKNPARIKWALGAAVAVPMPLIWILSGQAFSELPLVEGLSGWLFPVGWTGKVLFGAVTVLSTLVIANLERALRASFGRSRWQIKFMVLGLITLFAGRIYTSSHVLLFSVLSTQVERIGALLLLVAGGMIVVSLQRAGLMQIDLYVSPGLLHRSIAVVAVGAYLLTVAFAVKLAQYFEWSRTGRLEVLVVLLALLILALTIFSDRVRQGLRNFTALHFKRPRYDYRHIWSKFSSQTAPVLDSHGLCRVVVKLIAEVFETLCVSIWLTGEGHRTLHLGASSALSESEAHRLVSDGKVREILLQGLLEQEEFLEVEGSEEGWIQQLRELRPEFFEKAFLGFCIPLRAQEQVVGLLTLKDRVRGKPLTQEDLNLLQAIAEQTAAGLLNLSLSRELQQAKEVESFQAMSTFFLHDLKNIASRLSLTAQNLPRRFDNPEFREDARRAISQSVEKIQAYCRRLASMHRCNGLERSPVDLNQLVRLTLADLQGTLKGRVEVLRGQIPEAWLDAEQIRSVIENLLLNASQAITEEGSIQIQTSCRDGLIELAVSDDGCGMSEDFLENHLFRPFQSTKKNGMGIGLYQSKMIVEAHKGRIEVESQPGEGTVLRVHLPAVREGQSDRQEGDEERRFRLALR